MRITKRIEQFIKEVANIAVAKTEGIPTYSECIAEYTDQIVNDDYYFVVNYAHSQGIKIPRSLKSAIDPEF